jgi:hypothetical protein
MSDLDKAVESIEHGEAWDETDEVVQVEVKKPLSKVIKQEQESSVVKDYAHAIKKFLSRLTRSKQLTRLGIPH